MTPPTTHRCAGQVGQRSDDCACDAAVVSESHAVERQRNGRPSRLHRRPRATRASRPTSRRHRNQAIVVTLVHDSSSSNSPAVPPESLDRPRPQARPPIWRRVDDAAFRKSGCSHQSRRHRAPNASNPATRLPCQPGTSTTSAVQPWRTGPPAASLQRPRPDHRPVPDHGAHPRPAPPRPIEPRAGRLTALELEAQDHPQQSARASATRPAASLSVRLRSHVRDARPPA